MVKFPENVSSTNQSLRHCLTLWNNALKTWWSVLTALLRQAWQLLPEEHFSVFLLYALAQQQIIWNLKTQSDLSSFSLKPTSQSSKTTRGHEIIDTELAFASRHAGSPGPVSSPEILVFRTTEARTKLTPRVPRTLYMLLQTPSDTYSWPVSKSSIKGLCIWEKQVFDVCQTLDFKLFWLLFNHFSVKTNKEWISMRGETSSALDYF